MDELYLPFVKAFFQKCKAAIEKELPGTLFLGCRTHRGPNVLGRGALGSVDVFSVNVYDSRVRSWQVPADADIPILSSEFHFGAVDRGVPSPGLSGSWDQRQRALSFAHYLASALADLGSLAYTGSSGLTNLQAEKIVKTINVVSLMSQEKLMLNLSMLCQSNHTQPATKQNKAPKVYSLNY